MAQRRFQQHSGSPMFLEEEESYFFSKDKLLPKRIPQSLFRQKLGNLLNLFSKCSAFGVCIVGLTVFIIVVFLLYHYLSSLSELKQPHLQERSHLSSDERNLGRPPSGEAGEIIFSYHNEEDVISLSDWRSDNSDLTSRIDELHRIRTSVLAELRQLEKRREELRQGISQESQKLESIQANVGREERELSNIQSAIEQAKVAHQEAVRQQTPEISLPAKLLPPPFQHSVTVTDDDISGNNCTIETCLDFSRCSITAGLTVYVYPPSPTASESIRKAHSFLTSSPQAVQNWTQACIFVVLHEEGTVLNSLPFWHKQGTNHLVISLEAEPKKLNSRAAMIASPNSVSRPDFDFVIPPIMNFLWDKNNIWEEFPPLLPVARNYLMTFWGGYNPTDLSKVDETVASLLIENLKRIQQTKTDDKFFFRFACGAERSALPNKGDWSLCENKKARRDLMKHSKFALILPLLDGLLYGNKKTTRTVLTRISEALISGAVPVLLGPSTLPFEDRIDWDKIVIRSYSDADYLEMKRRGRLIFEKYLGTVEGVLSGLLASLRYRLFLPAVNSVLPEFQGSGAFAGGNWSPPASQVTEMPVALDPEEYLGPVEPPFPSVGFSQNFSQLTLHSYSTWNEELNPFQLFSYSPNRIPLPTGAKFYPETSIGFRPLGDGQGGSGKEFSRAIGGNHPREQFTIVILTYERESVLVSSLQRLNHLPYLNKIVVVWNSDTEPGLDTVWPKLSAPLVFVRPGKNSLNNRFLPLAQIETEAVLSIDDDVHLTQAEIIFAFRVWREERDRIVGFPGRFHAWDGEHNTWLYNSNHSCELSMVLTGAAFFHKYYAYLYTHWMPAGIREKVDTAVNCEDLAMNFLVSHLTRKPPVKVTSKWTFRLFPMDQEPFLNLGKIDTEGVKLDEAPLTAEEYLKQVIIDRSRHAETVVAEVPESVRMKTRQTEVVSPDSGFPQTDGVTPPRSWQEKQVADFSDLRLRIVKIRMKMKAENILTPFNCPEVGNVTGWRSFCLTKFSKQLDSSDDIAVGSNQESSSIQVPSSGTPPLLRVVFAMNQPQVVELLTYHIEWLKELGHSPEIMQWLFALLTVLEKPLGIIHKLRDTNGSTMEQVTGFDRQFSGGLADCVSGPAEVGGRAKAIPQTSSPPAKLAIKASHLRKRRLNRKMI